MLCAPTVTHSAAKPAASELITDIDKNFAELTKDKENLNISETAFGFTGITKQISEVRKFILDAVVERPTIEDILLGNIGGEK